MFFISLREKESPQIRKTQLADLSKNNEKTAFFIPKFAYLRKFLYLCTQNQKTWRRR